MKNTRLALHKRVLINTSQVFLVACIVSACASTKSNSKVEEVGQASSATTVKTESKISTPINQDSKSFDAKVGSAIASPFNDLNLVRTEIPERLIEARSAPYSTPVEASCMWITKEIQDLNAILGADVDAVKVDEKGNVVDQGAEQLGNAAVSTLRGFTEGVIPFRAWIRRLSGADRHAKDVASAGVAGIVRRAYLKGLAHGKSCPIELQRVLVEPVKGEVKTDAK
jgi:hypothetical protein